MVGREDTAGVGEAIGGARPGDPAGLVLARARVESALFGTATGLGRFHVLERLGRGGMGVVYAAYDPELDRGVALKMIHVPERGRELAIAEAKALARLSHPNVVPVFDVGVLEDHVYIVMELVRGVTLREWVKDRPARAIVEVYLQAGAALAAAHAAGLVHRDFKPDNAIVGGDGRVRVVDFGLACEAEAAAPPAGEAGAAGSSDAPAPHRGAGTPRYMAPEQAAGRVTPAADQHSFCVSLAEALDGGGARPPRWLADILDRGRAPDPAERFASMPELLRALGRDPARVWRRRVGLGVLAAAIGAAFLVGRARPAAGPEPCSGGDAEIAEAWPVAARAAQLRRIASLGPDGGELAFRIALATEEHAARWAAQHRDACLAHRRGVQSDALLDRRMACLARSRAALVAVAEIAGAAGASALPDVALAAAAIPDPAACTGSAGGGALGDVEPPPPSIAPRVAQLRDDLERARIQLAAGRANAARDAAHAAAAELGHLGYQPLLSEALLVEGHAAMRTDPAAAATTLRAATAAAIAAHHASIAIEAWARREWLEGRARPDAAFGGFEFVDALAERTSPFGRALLLNNFGSVELARGRRAEARELFSRALKVAGDVSGPGAVELVAIRRNLGLVVDDPAERDRLLADARAELAGLLGEHHPDTLLSEYFHAAAGILQMRAAADQLTITCERFELHEVLAPELPPCLGELGDLRAELGDMRGAAAAYDRALQRGGATHPGVPELAGYLALWRGAPSDAIRAFEQALATAPARAGQPFHLDYAHAKLRLGHARALRAAGRLADARAALERGLEKMREIDERSTTMLQRRLHRARAEYALVLAATNGKPAEVSELALRAISWYRRAGGAPAALAQLERLAGAATAGSP
jgi:tetratricopeptide (TPR) repeat protein/predicted Ser/Thr protein kinase